jgi:hypothetical protein
VVGQAAGHDEAAGDKALDAGDSDTARGVDVRPAQVASLSAPPGFLLVKVGPTGEQLEDRELNVAKRRQATLGCSAQSCTALHVVPTLTDVMTLHGFLILTGGESVFHSLHFHRNQRTT